MSEYTNSKKRFCSVYKSTKRSEMYLYVDRSQDVSKLPESLMLAFGVPTKVMDLVLTPEKTLARAEASKVLESIEAQDFYLQMPPADDGAAENLAMAPRDVLNG